MADKKINSQLMAPNCTYYFDFESKKGREGKLTITESRREGNEFAQSQISLDETVLGKFIDELTLVYRELHPLPIQEEVAPRVDVNPVRSGSPWEEAELKAMWNLHQKGKSFEEIAAVLERTTNVVKVRLRQMEFKNKHGGKQ
ncbi:hypothetical protein O3Q51_09795 [Cryomorphaceae bacterium 1068]|nr:hypothetical protein [Cryomorphaceae bacterium 1068]